MKHGHASREQLLVLVVQAELAIQAWKRLVGGLLVVIALLFIILGFALLT